MKASDIETRPGLELQVLVLRVRETERVDRIRLINDAGDDPGSPRRPCVIEIDIIERGSSAGPVGGVGPQFGGEISRAVGFDKLIAALMIVAVCIEGPGVRG